MTVNPSMPSLNVSRFWEFLQREMEPTPGRWQATLRITLACVICTIPIEMFHLQEPLIVVILLFAISRGDTTTTLLGTALGMIGLTIGCAGLLLFYLSGALDLDWVRVLAVPVVIAIGLFINRVVTLGPLGTTISLPLTLGIITPDTVSNPEILNRYPFYFWWAAVLGLSVNLAVQYLFNPQTAQSLLVRELLATLDAVETMLRRLAAGEKIEPSKSSMASFAFNGAAQQLQLLKLASTVESLLKKRQSEFSAQIILADRLVTAAVVMETQPLVTGNEPVKKRLLWMAEMCAIWRTALKEHHTPVISMPPIDTAAVGTNQEIFPTLSEMEHVIELMPLTFQAERLPDELKLPSGKMNDVIAPDAFSNPEYIRFAIKGALAGFICYLIFTLFDYPGIYTSVITCVVCSLTTIGASVQKGYLRLAGACIGGIFGVIALVYIFPHLDSLGGFWFPFAAVTALAAYVNFGSPRISYCGFQIVLAFDKCVLQTYGTYTELRVVRDRFVGIALGLLVFGTINSQLWPVSALETLRSKVADIFRQLARLAGLPDENKNPSPRLAEAYKLRLQTYQDFSSAHELLESSQFENHGMNRENLALASNQAKALLVHLLAIIQQRPDLRPDSVPEPLRAASLRFRTTLADLLENLSVGLQGKPVRPLPDMEAALAELEQIFAIQIKTVTDANLAAHLRGRLALYQETVPFAMELVRLHAG